MVDLEAEVGRVHAENDRLRRALANVCGQIVLGRLTGELPDNFLEQFSKLPDRPMEQVLRCLPARQVAQMRHVSRRFNSVCVNLVILFNLLRLQLIKKCSKTMPKK